MFKWLRALLPPAETAESQHLRGRQYALNAIARDNSEKNIEKLWNQSDTDGTFGGNGHFDRGIADVLHEKGYIHPDDPYR